MNRRRWRNVTSVLSTTAVGKWLANLKTSRSIKCTFVSGLAAVALALGTAHAAEVAGVTIEDRARVGTSDLVLNGAGLRKHLIVNVYVAGLYLTEKKTAPVDIINLAGPKRIAMTLMRDLSAQTLVDALSEGLKGNTPEPELIKLKAASDELSSVMLTVKEAKKGDVVALDFLPDSGTQVLVNGRPLGKPIAGADFYKAILRIWIGESPVDSGLKKGLLGG
jgi:Chalcone isomerase-like